jgi:hypothetical protein
MLAGRRRLLLIFLITPAIALAGAMLLATAFLHARAPAASRIALASTSKNWSEESWPFPIDQWGTGRAFRRGDGPCGADLHLYLRAKIGFCRCATGVSDDDEIDRVGDTELFGSDYRPTVAGHPVVAGLLKGRARQFTVQRSFASSIPILTIALANKCDAVVATIAAGSELTSAQEAAALDFLRDERIQRWAAANTQSQ